MVAWVAALVPLVIELVRRVEADRGSSESATAKDGLIALYGLLQDWCHAAEQTNLAFRQRHPGGFAGEPRIQIAAIKSFQEALWPTAKRRWAGRPKRPEVGRLLAVYAPDLEQEFRELLDARLALVETLEDIPADQMARRLCALQLDRQEFDYELTESLAWLQYLAGDLREFIVQHFPLGDAVPPSNFSATFDTAQQFPNRREGRRSDPRWR